MNKHFTYLSVAAVVLSAVLPQILADDAVPPKPPGGSSAPAASTATPAPGNPQSGEGRGAGRLNPEERIKRMTEALGLTQEQQDKIKAIMEKDAPKFKELMSKGRENLTEEDKTKFRELLKTQAEEIAAVLTPEQKEKYKGLLERRRASGAGGAPSDSSSK